MDQEPNNLNLNILEEDDENIEENFAYLQDRQEEEEEEDNENRNEHEERDENEEIRWETPNRYSFVNYEYLQNVAGVQYSQNGKLLQLNSTQIIVFIKIKISYHKIFCFYPS
jgi:hypothetical protein